MTPIEAAAKAAYARLCEQVGIAPVWEDEPLMLRESYIEDAIAALEAAIGALSDDTIDGIGKYTANLGGSFYRAFRAALRDAMIGKERGQ